MTEVKMKNHEMAERLIAVFNALNNIEVKGIHNVSTLAGSLQIIKEILEAQTQEQDNAKDD
jgi:hypothetical protein